MSDWLTALSRTISLGGVVEYMKTRKIRLALSLREEPFLRGMSDHVVAKIETLVYHREYETRQIVYFPDDPCDFVYWMREGRIKVTRVSGDGRELTFRHLLPGDMLGEDCLGGGSKRNDYAEAMEPTILCLMRADDFCRIAREEPEFAFAVAERLARRVKECEHVLADTVFSPVRTRIASGLLRLYRRENNRVGNNLRVTHQEIANLVGSTRETTTAVLHLFREEGILEMANRRLTLLNPAALEEMSQSRH